VYSCVSWCCIGGAASEMVRVKKQPRGDEVGCADSSQDVSMAEAAFFGRPGGVRVFSSQIVKLAGRGIAGSLQQQRLCAPPSSWLSLVCERSQQLVRKTRPKPAVAPAPERAAEAPSRSLLRAAYMQVASYSTAPAAVGGAQDVLVVRHSDGTLRSTDWHVVFSRLGNAPAEVHLPLSRAVPEPHPGP